MWVNLCRNGEQPGNSPKLALECPKMALKRLKTREFETKPDQFAEYRKNTQEMKGVVFFEWVYLDSREEKATQKNVLTCARVPINADTKNTGK